MSEGKQYRNDKKEVRNKNGQGSKVRPALKERTKKTWKDNQCRIADRCGGCMGQEQSYEEHLMQKQKLVEELIGPFCPIEPIIGMEEPYHYRNKVHAVFSHDKNGNPVCGVYEEGSHKVVPVEKCLIEDKKASAIILSIRDLLKSFKIKTFSEDSGYGLLRHVLVRTGHQSGEIMVVLVLSSLIMPSKNNFVKALRKIHPEITTVIINENYKSTSMVLGEKEQVIYGKGFIEDTLCGKKFRISSKSFYQINPIQTEKLYEKAISYAGLSGKETILDAYCGIGTIGIIASDNAKKVISVELNPTAVRDAISNVKRNGIQNIDFYTKDAGEFMVQFAESTPDRIDVVFMDPPRSGSDEAFLSALVKLSPAKVVYISCNPRTMERDLTYLTENGYRAVKGVGCDMFPWTGHVESIILMTYCGSGDEK